MSGCGLLDLESMFVGACREDGWSGSLHLLPSMSGVGNHSRVQVSDVRGYMRGRECIKIIPCTARNVGSLLFASMHAAAFTCIDVEDGCGDEGVLRRHCNGA